MDRINSAGTILDANGHRIRQDKNLATGTSGTELSAPYDNDLQESLIAGVIEAAGETPTAGEVAQVMRCIAKLIGGGWLGGEYLGHGAFSVTVPAGATRARVTPTGGGAGGYDCQTQGSAGALTFASGGGGGAGASTEWDITVVAGDTISGTVGGGGGSNTSGGDTTVIHGTQSVICGGGNTAVQNGPTSAAGGGGGTVTTVPAQGSAGAPVLNWIAKGGFGGDGQTSNFIFPGNGGNSIYGGGGRAGLGTNGVNANVAGEAGQAPGAGGGGAYSPNLESATFYYGGAGGGGWLRIDFYSR